MPVTRLVAHCELASESARQANFDVTELAVLDDGTEFVLRAERGYSAGIPHPGATFPWHTMSIAGIEADVRTVVLPDDAETTGEELDWPALAAALRAAGVDATPDDLRAVPVEVRLGSILAARLAAAGVEPAS